MIIGGSMDNKLGKLLGQISWDEKKYSYFEGGKLEKIVGNKDKTEYTFFISIVNTLPADVFDEFIHSLKEAFGTVDRTIVLFNIDNIEQERLQEYFTYLIGRYSKKCPAILTIVDSEVEIREKTLIIPVNNISEENKLYGMEKEIIMDFRSFGYMLDRINPVMADDPFSIIEDETEIVVSPERLEKKDTYEEDFPKKKYKPKPIETEDHPEVILGRLIDTDYVRLDSITGTANSVTLEAEVFGLEVRETRTELVIMTLKVTDYTDSIYAKVFINDKETKARLEEKVKVGNWYKFRGSIKEDKYSNEDSLSIHDINICNKEVKKIIDDAPIKRVELHAHTMMSQMDGVVEAKSLLKTARKWGHKAIAITDHNGCQSFPEVYKFVKGEAKNTPEGEEPFKAIYGAEMIMIDDSVTIVTNPTDAQLLATTYVVFDTETTGFNAGGADQMIEIGAVKICNGEIIDTFDELINPGRKLTKKITDVTNITDKMLVDKRSEEEVVKTFMDWTGTLPMVAHNAKFDISFIDMAFKKYNLGSFDNTVIDTLELSRTLDNNFARHSLSAIVKRYEVEFDEEGHHRADYDSKATALVFHKMIKKLVDRNFETIADIDKLVDKAEIHKYGSAHHINLLALNREGLKNLFRIVSYANTTYLYKTPRILRSKVAELREGLLVGSGCYESEVFTEAASKDDEELTNIINFYDYVEVQPPEVYDHLLQTGEFASKEELLDHIGKIVRVTKDAGRTIVATGDVHHLYRDNRMYREIIVNQKVPGGGRHPLAKSEITKIPDQHFRTTREMLDDFAFLGEDLAYEIVVENTNKLADMVDMVEVIIETKGVPFSPKLENSKEITTNMVYDKAYSLYGNPLPELISIRIEQELSGITKGGYDVIYLIAQKLVKKSNDDGYLVGSRGSVGSSFIAFLMGITEVNSLPVHYVCPKCKHTIFEDEKGEDLSKRYSSGCDLPAKNCSCGERYNKEGHNIPFSSFLGFNADKVPDIDLNFSGDYQAKAHEYTKELFGADNVFRAGTVGTVAEKTAFGFVKGYCEDKGIVKRQAEIERIALGCMGVKRSTGQHPGGIVVIPNYMEIFDFTPYQYPADDVTSAWRTTHFDYHPMEEEILKLDILGHDDPTMLRMLQDLSGLDVLKIEAFDDPKVLSLLSGTEVLGVTPEEIMCKTGTLGVPELGTRFVMQMLEDTKPNTFGGLVKISGLSHGTGVWAGNAKDLIDKGIATFDEIIGCREELITKLMGFNMDGTTAFKITEFVRKSYCGRDAKMANPKWLPLKDELIKKEYAIPEWFIDSVETIEYMFPKAHATAYVMSALRIAWFKVYHPLYYYTAYFSIRCNDFDIEMMIKGADAIRARIMEINNQEKVTDKDFAIADVLSVALEASVRGFKFANLSIDMSDATKFKILDDVTMIPPFRTLDGLGDTVARNIVEEREKSPFLSIEDVQKRAKISGTLIDKMKSMGIFEGMEESNQISLF